MYGFIDSYKIFSDPTKNGYEFSHWAYDNKEFDFNTNITSDITLLAVWNKKKPKKIALKF